MNDIFSINMFEGIQVSNKNNCQTGLKKGKLINFEMFHHTHKCYFIWLIID